MSGTSSHPSRRRLVLFSAVAVALGGAALLTARPCRILWYLHQVRSERVHPQYWNPLLCAPCSCDRVQMLPAGIPPEPREATAFLISKGGEASPLVAWTLRRTLDQSAALDEDYKVSLIHLLFHSRRANGAASLGEALRIDTSVIVRAAAARALGKCENAGGKVYLIDGLADPSPLVRMAIADALAEIGDPDCERHLLILTRDADAETACYAMRRVSGFTGPEVLESLQRIVDEGGAQRSQVAAQVLDLMRSHARVAPGPR